MPKDDNPIMDHIKLRLPKEEKALEASKLIGQALRLLGMDCDQSMSTHRTPDRFVGYLREFLQPFNSRDIIGEGFEALDRDTSMHGLIIENHIPFTGVCEHHLLPMQGEAAVGYIPNDRVIGLSKIVRLVEAVGHERPSLQESITERIASALNEGLDARGVMVVLSAKHGCMSCRGVNAPEVVTITSCIKGLFRDVPAVREEFLALTGMLRL
jgi:GTP cyclohydrolase I